MRLSALAALAAAVLLVSGCTTTTFFDSSGAETEAPPEPDYEKAYQDYVRLGAEYVRRGHYDLAEPKLRRAIEINSEPPEAWNILAVLYEQTRDISAGTQVYQKLIGSHPNYALGFINYATFLCKFQQESERQTLYGQMRSKGNEFTALSYIADGNCQRSRNHMAAARSAYQDALRYDPHAPGALLPLADILVEQGDYQGAINYLNVMHTYVGYSPDSVRIGILAARGAGNTAMETDLMRVMRGSYTDTPQAKSLGL